MEKKIRLLTISDHPLGTSGVGIQTRQIIEGLVKTGKFEIHSFAGAIEHQSYNIIKTQEYKDDWVIYPVKDFGSQDQVRSFVRMQRPDMLWFMTDPRFYIWLWQIAPEIREQIPLVYYNVWDNFPVCDYNKPLWGSNDVLVSMSKVTNQLNEAVVPWVERHHIPLSVNTDLFKKSTNVEEVKNLRNKITNGKPEKTIFFWNNRNARRKQPGTLVFWFKNLLDEIGHDKACLVMHTRPIDQFGTNLEACLKHVGLVNGEVQISPQNVPPEFLSMFYTVADCTINISDAEGVGMSCIESMSCETPIIATKTGGLQEQTEDEFGNKTGISLEPASRSVVGTVDIPYIYEDRVSEKDFIVACKTIIGMSQEERDAMGKVARAHVLRNFNLAKTSQQWIDLLQDIYQRHGSWNTRKNYKPWTCEVK